MVHRFAKLIPWQSAKEGFYRLSSGRNCHRSNSGKDLKRLRARGSSRPRDHVLPTCCHLPERTPRSRSQQTTPRRRGIPQSTTLKFGIRRDIVTNEALHLIWLGRACPTHGHESPRLIIPATLGYDGPIAPDIIRAKAMVYLDR
jgi:hypothetical protein